MKIILKPSAIMLTLIWCVGLLFLANGLGIVSTYYWGRPTVLGLVQLFSFDHENNVPTLYSAMAIILAGLLLVVIAVHQRRSGQYSAGWFFLAMVFLFLAIDETSSIHEQVGPLFVSMLDTFGLSLGDWILIHYAWLVPYGVFVALVLVFCAPLLRALPARFVWLFLIAGSVYLAGAAGFEILGGLERGENDTRSLRYAILCTMEELLEMLGVLIFIHALLQYISAIPGGMTLEMRH